MATPSPARAPLRPVGHKAHGEAVLAAGSRNRGCETRRERWRWGARAQSIPAPGSRPAGSRHTSPWGFSSSLGPKGSSAGFKAGAELGLMSSGEAGTFATPCDRPFLPRYRHATPAAWLQPPSLPKTRCPPLAGEGTVVIESPPLVPDSSWVYLLHDRKLFFTSSLPFRRSAQPGCWYRAVLYILYMQITFYLILI